MNFLWNEIIKVIIMKFLILVSWCLAVFIRREFAWLTIQDVLLLDLYPFSSFTADWQIWTGGWIGGGQLRYPFRDRGRHHLNNWRRILDGLQYEQVVSFVNCSYSYLPWSEILTVSRWRLQLWDWTLTLHSVKLHFTTWSKIMWCFFFFEPRRTIFKCFSFPFFFFCNWNKKLKLKKLLYSRTDIEGKWPAPSFALARYSGCWELDTLSSWLLFLLWGTLRPPEDLFSLLELSASLPNRISNDMRNHDYGWIRELNILMDFSCHILDCRLASSVCSLG